MTTPPPCEALQEAGSLWGNPSDHRARYVPLQGEPIYYTYP